MNKELTSLLAQLNARSNEMSTGAGAVTSGAINGGVSLIAAYLANKQAEKDRKIKTDMFNKETLLNVNQQNMDLNRLAGLDYVHSGAKRADQLSLAAQGLVGQDLIKAEQQALSAGKANVQANNKALSSLVAADFQL